MRRSASLHGGSRKAEGETVINPNADISKHKEIPIWNAENWLYEDFEIGKRARSLRRTISEGESMLFNAIVLDMHPYVADDVFAKNEGMFGKRLVAGAMVFSLGLGLMAHNNVHTFSYGYDKLRFIKPVFVGDTIYTIRTQLEKWPKYPELGMVKVSYEVFKMPGELVLYCEHLQTVKYRDPSKVKVQQQQTSEGGNQ
jgi:acyl dehydratase